MRLHRLAAAAFGPFPGRVEVDFDALSETGLFLIHGPTGSGKTSLLDAVCFALYADVPGHRGKRGPAVRPRGARRGPDGRARADRPGRRLRLPADRRLSAAPSGGAPGMRTMAATVSLEERRPGGWEPLSTRPDEVADVVKDVLGMGLEQFAKVVLLPQGEFAAFLRATRRAAARPARAAVRHQPVRGRRGAGSPPSAARRRRRSRRPRQPCSTDLARLGDVLAEPGEVGAEGCLGLGDRRLCLAALGGEPLLDIREPADVEQPLEEVAPLLVARPEEGGELALGEEDDLGQLLQPHPEHVLDDVGDLVRTGAQRLHPPGRRSSRETVAAIVLIPVPRRLGRLKAAVRRSRSRRPWAVSASFTVGTASGSAWSDRRPSRPGDPARRRTGRSRRRRAGSSCRTRSAHG